MGTLTERGRSVARGVFAAPARALLRLHVSPDAVTIVGTVGTSVAVLWFIPQGEFVWAFVVAIVFVFSDSLDGTMARMSGRSSAWGAFFDSTLDRVTDAAVFCGIALYYAGRDTTAGQVWLAVTLAALVGSLLVSYARARADGIGVDASVGIAERTERLVIVGAGVLLAGLWDVRFLAVAVCVVAALAWVTVVQRLVVVRRATAATPPT
jgi:CDP-diacylglycerol---glycerol-3-phosphate 3-phosphatidyltransferase